MKTLRNIQTKDRVVQAVRNEILEGNMEPGEELAQEALAEMLGVSRMPVREALQTLVEEGFVQRMPNRHMKAVVLDNRQVRGVFQTAASIEAEMLAMAVENQNEGVKRQDAAPVRLSEELKEILIHMEETENSDRKAEYEIEFHRRISKAADNPYLEQLQKKLLDGYIAFAIENSADKEHTEEILAKAVKALEKDNLPETAEYLKEYYAVYADVLADRRKK